MAIFQIVENVNLRFKFGYIFASFCIYDSIECLSLQLLDAFPNSNGKQSSKKFKFVMPLCNSFELLFSVLVIIYLLFLLLFLYLLIYIYMHFFSRRRFLILRDFIFHFFQLFPLLFHILFRFYPLWKIIELFLINDLQIS